MFFASASLYARKVDYEDLAKNGEYKEIKKEFRKTRSLNVRKFGKNKETFLMMVLSNDREYKIVKLCLYFESDVRAKAKDGRTPLMFAAEHVTDTETIKLILKTNSLTRGSKRRKILKKDKDGFNSFDYAKKNKEAAIYETLCEYADDPSVEKKEDEATGEEAGEQAEVAESLQEQPVNAEEVPVVPAEAPVPPVAPIPPAAPVPPVPLPVPVAVESPVQEEKPSEQIAEKAQVNSPAPEQIEIMPEVAAVPVQPQQEDETNMPKEEFIQEPVLDKKTEIKQYAKTFLYDYAESEHEKIRKEEGNKQVIENPNETDENKVTILMKACRLGNDWDVRKLLENNADVQLRDKDGWTALMYACKYQNNLNIVNMLIERGALIRVRNKFNATPLLLAANYSQNPEILNVLLKNRSGSENEVFKAFIFAITENSSSPYVRNAKVQLFINKEIPVNRLWNGKTALMYACQYGQDTAIIKQLIDAGANTRIQDENGKTAFDYAKINRGLAHDDIYWSLNSTETK